MRKLKGRSWAKITAYIMFLICAVLVVASVWVTIEQVERGYYKDDGKEFYNQRLEDTVEIRLEDLAHWEIEMACEEYLSVFGKSTGNNYDYFVSWYDEIDSNLCFTVTDAHSGALIAENYKSDNPLAETRATFDLYISLDEADKDAILNAVPHGENSWLLTRAQEYLSLPQEERDKEHPYNHVPVTLTLTGYVNGNFTAIDDFYFQHQLHKLFVALCPAAVYIGIFALIVGIFMLCFLISAAGYKAGVEGIVLNPFDRIPTDLYLAGLVVFVISVVYIVYDIMWYDDLAFGISLFALIALLSPVALLSIAARTRAKTLFKNTVIYRLVQLLKRNGKRLWRGAKYLFHHIPLFWKTLLVYGAICLVEFFLIIEFSYYSLPGKLVILWIFIKLAILMALVFVVLNLQALKKGVKALADGDLEHNVSTKYMFWEFKDCADQLNSISVGMQKAVEVQLKNERLKTELITNVSHDIKTPLTSIINYVDLLKKEELDNERATEYLDILDRQSARLKKLTEDLVEASKADTGNIAVALEKTDVSVLLTQLSGEYEERLAAGGLQLVTDIRSRAAILADGRLLQRIFDNLLNNICKYGMENTRVYLTCDDDGNEVQITFKNISKYPLNITSDELMERFVRGDSSRNTEGSGLGLSIAKSLAKLQNAQIHLHIDGDLFKAMIRFKIAK